MKGQSIHHGCCPAVHGSSVVLGQNGLRVSTMGLRAMLVPLPWAVSWSIGPASLLGTSFGDRSWFLKDQTLISVSPRAEQRAPVGYLEVTLPAPGPAMRGSLCSWKSFCRVDDGEAGNKAALPTGVQKGWGGRTRPRLTSSTVHISSATTEHSSQLWDPPTPASQPGQHRTTSPTEALCVEQSTGPLVLVI